MSPLDEPVGLVCVFGSLAVIAAVVVVVVRVLWLEWRRIGRDLDALRDEMRSP